MLQDVCQTNPWLACIPESEGMVKSILSQTRGVYDITCNWWWTFRL